MRFESNRRCAPSSSSAGIPATVVYNARQEPLPDPMSSQLPLILQVAVPSPLLRTFDYLAPPDTGPERLRPGIRVRVPFGNRRQIGMIVAVSDSSRDLNGESSSCWVSLRP